MNRGLLSSVCVLVAALLGLASQPLLRAQTDTGSIHGRVTDPSGGVVPGAAVQAVSADGRILTAATGNDGAYEINSLAPGSYSVTVSAAGFALFKKDSVDLAAGGSVALNVSLSLAEQTQQVTVSGEAQSLDTAPANNVGAIVVSGKELDALPDDPDELQADLQALAGPAAGPNGGEMYIDGFTAGQLPPKSSIREIRINQNPFTAEFDQLGFGRIEIFTKPGSNSWHGSVSVNHNQAALNSRNPFATSQGDFQSTQYTETLGGPLGRKASVFFNADYRDIGNESVITAFVLDPNFNPVPYTTLNPLPQTRLNIGPRIDYQLTKNNTLSIRYQYLRNHAENNGVGGLVLPAQGSNNLLSEDQLQLIDSQYFGSRVVYETRFQFLRDDTDTIAANFIPSVNVPGAFTGGGGGNNIDLQNHYELQSYTSIAFVKHFLRFGVRVREVTDSNNSNAGFFGAFQFASLSAYQATVRGLASGMTMAQILAQPQCVVPGTCGPTQYSVTAGNPVAYASMIDAGPFIEDDWKVRPNITLSLGLRFETQNRISDHADWAPRLGLAWGLGGSKTAPKYVLRVGSGLFYNRFALANVLQAERLNGLTEQQYIVSNPNFYCGPASATATTAVSACPAPASLASISAGTTPTIYQIAPVLHTPYFFQTAVTLERQLNKSVQVALIYLNTRGFDQLITENINSPVLPGTQIPDAVTNGGVYPNGVPENIYQYTSAGRAKYNLVIPNATIRSRRLVFNAYYLLGYADSTPTGPALNGQATSAFVSDAYDIWQDYGRAQFDIRNRAFLIGSITLPWGFTLAPSLFISSGTPYSVTLGKDLIDSSIFNQRPALVSSAACPATQITGNIYCTPFGTFNTVPAPGEALLPVDSLTGPGQFTLNLQLTKTFVLGAKHPEATGPASPFPPAGSPPPQGPAPIPGRYGLVFSANARNALNNVNLATPVGNITSPFFGQSIALSNTGPGGTAAANRQIYLQGAFNF